MQTLKITAKNIDCYLKQSMLLLHKHGFVILFYTLWLVGMWLETQNRLLEDFHGRIISAASANLLHASDRTVIAFEAIALVILVSSLIAYILYVLRHYLSESTFKSLQASSFVGVLLFFFHIFIPNTIVLTFAYWIAIIQVCSITGSILSKYSTSFSFTTSPIYTSWISILSLAFTILAHQTQTAHGKFFIPFSTDPTKTFAMYVLVIFLCSIIWRTYIWKKYSSIADDESTLAFLLVNTLPLTAFLFLPFLSLELPLIAKNYSMHISSKDVLTLLGPSLLLISLGLFIRKQSSLNIKSSSILFLLYFPLLICATSILNGYTPTEPPLLDMFEPANPGLLIQQFFDFGKIPYLETFGAHGFSDAFWGFLYSFINGYDVHNWTHYDFFQRVFELVISYFFLKKLTNNAYIALSIIIFFPYIGVLFPPFFTVCLLFFYLFLQTISSKKFSSHVLISTVIILFFLWRIDIAVASLLALIATLILSSVTSIKIPFKWASLGIAFSIVSAIIFTIFAILCSIKNIAITQWLQTFLHVINSNQAFAVLELYSKEDSYSAWAYFVTPLILILSIPLLIIGDRLRCLIIKKTVLLSYLFLTTFVLINLSLRGVIRHTLTENTTVLVLTFSFLLLGGIAFFSLKKFGNYMQLSAFFLVSTFIVYNFSLPIQALQINTSLLPTTIASLYTDYSKKPKRNSPSKNQIQSENHYTRSDEIITFIKEQLNANETFFDFSTSPMLYAYTHKNTPFYTNHLMLMNDDYLQDQVLQQLRKFDTPLVVFAYTNQYTYNLDGIPFQLRYYKITEHIYQNYHPFTILDNREIWIRNDWQPKESPPKILQDYVSSLKNVTINQITRDSSAINSFQATGADPFVKGIIQQEKVVLRKDLHYYLHLQANSTVSGPVQVFYDINNSGFHESQSHTLSADAGNNSLYFPIRGFKDGDSLNDFRIDVPDGSIVTFGLLELVVSRGTIYNHIEHSTLSQKFQTKYIPFIWGTYDSVNVDQLHAAREVTPSTTYVPYTNLILPTSNVLQFEFQPLSSDEKNGGMYIVLHLKAGNKNKKEIGTKNTIDEEKLALHYGDQSGINGSVHFSALRDGKTHRYAIRISSQYAWKEFQNSQILIETNHRSRPIVESLSLVYAEQ